VKIDLHKLYKRIKIAADQDKGVHLSADETYAMVYLDTAISQAIDSLDLEEKGEVEVRLCRNCINFQNCESNKVLTLTGYACDSYKPKEVRKTCLFCGKVFADKTGVRCGKCGSLPLFEKVT
jgi:rRNA maturation endonuclease Nob1